MELKDIPQLENNVGQQRVKSRVTSISGITASANAVRQSKRQFGLTREHQLQLVNDSNNEIADFLATAGFTCPSMQRGIGKRLVCLRRARGARDE